MSFPSTDHLTHDHAFLSLSHDENARRTLIVVWLTGVMMVGEIIAGYLTGSMALLADGFHMATHAGALSVAALAYAFAKRHSANRQFSFGTGKVGDLAGFASALLLGLVALGIGWESLLRLFQPTKVAFGEAAWVAALGLLVNVVSALLLGGSHHAHHHDGHSHDARRDNNLRSAYFHVVADAFTSVLAIIALLSGQFLGWIWLDPVMGVVGSVVIGRWSWSLLRDTATVLLDSTDPHVAEEMQELVERPGDAKVIDLHVWRIGPDHHAGIVSVATTGGVAAEDIRSRLAPVHELAHLTVEVREIESA